MATASEISDRILNAVLAKKLQPGSRLVEQQLANLFECSRTIVREALTGLAARGIVAAKAGSGWYLSAPSKEEAREAFEARLVIESGLLRTRQHIDKASMKRLQAHIKAQQSAIKGSDVGIRSFLLGDFHVCLAECLGNNLLAETLRDFTARTTLIALMNQKEEDAAHSCNEHVQIVEALGRGDFVAAEKLMTEHLSTWDEKLPMPTEPHPLSELRKVLVRP